MPMSEIAEGVALARWVAGFGLASDGETLPVSVSDQSWSPAFAYLNAQRLTGLAVAAAEAGALSLTESQEEELLRGHRDAMVWVLGIERSLLSLRATFEASGVEFVVLKGPTFAHGPYPDPSWRPFADLDLLVRGRDWRRACEVLEAEGYHRDLPEPRRGFDERFGKAATHTGPGGLQVDLHRTLVLGPFGLWLDPDGLFDRAERFELAGRTLLRLNDTALLLHAAMHASLGWRPPFLLSVRDVAQVAESGAVDWEEARVLARRWRLAAVVRHAFGAGVEMLGIHPPEEAAGLLALSPRRREVRALEAYTTERRGRGGMALSTIGAIHGPRAKLAYVWGLIFPDRRFLTARMGGGERSSYRGRWKVAFRWLRRRQRSIQR
jgi:hypothetical protein